MMEEGTMCISREDLRKLLEEVVHLRKQRDELQRVNNIELEKRRAAEKRLKELGTAT